MKHAKLVFLIAIVTSVAFAQEMALEEIVVTASRSDVAYYEMPAVTTFIRDIQDR